MLPSLSVTIKVVPASLGRILARGGSAVPPPTRRSCGGGSAGIKPKSSALPGFGQWARRVSNLRRDSPRPPTLIIASSGVANATGVSRTDGVLTPFREGVVRASLLTMNDDQGGPMLTVTRAVERDLAGPSGVTDSQLRQIRLLVVEDHPVVRLGLVQLLEGQRDFSVDAVCTRSEE